MERILFVQVPEDEFFNRLADAVCLRLEARFQNLARMDAQSPNQKWMTHKEAAAYLRITSATLYGLTSKRKIKFYKRGKRNYYCLDDIEKYLSDGAVKTELEIRDSVIWKPRRRK